MCTHERLYFLLNLRLEGLHFGLLDKLEKRLECFLVEEGEEEVCESFHFRFSELEIEIFVARAIWVVSFLQSYSLQLYLLPVVLRVLPLTNVLFPEQNDESKRFGRIVIASVEEHIRNLLDLQTCVSEEKLFAFSRGVKLFLFAFFGSLPRYFRRLLLSPAFEGHKGGV